MTSTHSLLNRRGFICALAGFALNGHGASAAMIDIEPNIYVGPASTIGKVIIRAGVVERNAYDLRIALQISNEQPQNLICRRWMQQIRNDFANADTVYVDGWTLSLTEARLYALASLPATEWYS